MKGKAKVARAETSLLAKGKHQQTRAKARASTETVTRQRAVDVADQAKLLRQKTNLNAIWGQTGLRPSFIETPLNSTIESHSKAHTKYLHPRLNHCIVVSCIDEYPLAPHHIGQQH